MNTQETAIKKPFGIVGKTVLQIILVIIAVIQIYPLVWLALFSLKDNSEIFSGNVAGNVNEVVKSFRQMRGTAVFAPAGAHAAVPFKGLQTGDIHTPMILFKIRSIPTVSF